MDSENNASTRTQSSGARNKSWVKERRGFIKGLTTTTFVLGIGGGIAQVGRFLKPNVLYEPSKVFKVGTLSKFPIGSRVVIEGRDIEVVREKDGLHAVSLICTHLGCLVKSVANDPEVGYTCPCHGSDFAPDGGVLGGPAPADLPWFEVYLDHMGALVVDTSKVNHKRTKFVV